MRNIAFENQLASLTDRNAGPLSWWRTLPFTEFCTETRIVESAVASIVAVSRLAPPQLIAELAAAQDEELVPVWNDLAMLFFSMDRMNLGVAYEIAGSCAALSSAKADALGTVLVLKALSEPYVPLDPDTRSFVASTWLAHRGTLLNQTTLSCIDWWQSERGYQSPPPIGTVDGWEDAE